MLESRVITVTADGSVDLVPNPGPGKFARLISFAPTGDGPAWVRLTDGTRDIVGRQNANSSIGSQLAPFRITEDRPIKAEVSGLSGNWVDLTVVYEICDSACCKPSCCEPGE